MRMLGQVGECFHFTPRSFGAEKVGKMAQISARLGFFAAARRRRFVVFSRRKKARCCARIWHARAAAWIQSATAGKGAKGEMRHRRRSCIRDTRDANAQSQSNIDQRDSFHLAARFPVLFFSLLETLLFPSKLALFKAFPGCVWNCVSIDFNFASEFSFFKVFSRNGKILRLGWVYNLEKMIQQ